MTTALLLLLYVLALGRVTRLVNADTITDPVRIAVARRWGEDGVASYFLQCPWCVSMWVAFASAPYIVWLDDTLSWWALPVIALAGSYVVGMAAQLDHTEDVELVVENDDDSV